MHLFPLNHDSYCKDVAHIQKTYLENTDSDKSIPSETFILSYFSFDNSYSNPKNMRIIFACSSKANFTIAVKLWSFSILYKDCHLNWIRFSWNYFLIHLLCHNLLSDLDIQFYPKVLCTLSILLYFCLKKQKISIHCHCLLQYIHLLY